MVPGRRFGLSMSTRRGMEPDRPDDPELQPESDPDDALAFKIHGVARDFLEKLVDLGFEDLDAEDVLDFKIHGFDRLLRKRRVRR